MSYITCPNCGVEDLVPGGVWHVNLPVWSVPHAPGVFTISSRHARYARPYSSVSRDRWINMVRYAFCLHCAPREWRFSYPHPEELEEMNARCDALMVELGYSLEGAST